MPIYPTLALCAAAAVVLIELCVLRSGLLREPAYWISMAICIGFMIPVDGWLTKHSAPIVTYRPEDTSGISPIWDIPLEEYVYAFALLTLVMLAWDRLGPPAVGHEPVRRARAGESEQVSM
ncbi:MAG: lycopene cyclase domain-containing protein [Acidimicrobiales bacterium]